MIEKLLIATIPAALVLAGVIMTNRLSKRSADRAATVEDRKVDLAEFQEYKTAMQERTKAAEDRAAAAEQRAAAAEARATKAEARAQAAEGRVSELEQRVAELEQHRTT